MMYKLHIREYRENKSEHIIKIKYLRWLLKEILGYTDEEIQQMHNKHYGCDIVQHLTIQEAFIIAQAFEDYDVLPMLMTDEGTSIWWNQVGGLQPPNPKKHYCDEPMISRDHLINPMEYYAERAVKANQYAQQLAEQDRANVPKCPTCKSTNIEKISALKKTTKVGLFGIFGAGDIGKTWKCNNCGSRF